MRVDAKTFGETKQGKTKSVNHVTIHDVHILDSSSSMDGPKYTSAIEGLNSDIKASKETEKSTPGLTSTMTIIEFDNKIVTHMFMKPIQEVDVFTSRNFGDMTALNRAIGETIERMLAAKKPEDKVLMKIFTDGGENASRGSKYQDKKVLSALIEKVQKEDNFTITFVGTQPDVDTVIRDLKIDRSNTLTHNNTSASIKMSYNSTVKARRGYAAGAMAGEDVSTGFYTKTIKN